VPDGGGQVRGFFAGDAFMAMEVCDARDFDGILRLEQTCFQGLRLNPRTAA
jgi:hypothetical protein